MEIKAILFDLDGVLINSMPVHLKAFNQVLNEKGISVTNNQIAGRSTKEVMENLYNEFPQHPFDIIELSKKKSELANQMLRSLGLSILPKNIDQVLRKLFENYLLMICTSGSSKSLENFYRLTNLKHLFQGDLNSENVNRLKPDPEIYLKACDFLSLNPKECVVVEDSIAGCTAAHLAGCNLIILKNDFAPSVSDFPGSVMISDIRELENVFRT